MLKIQKETKENIVLFAIIMFVVYSFMLIILKSEPVIGERFIVKREFFSSSNGSRAVRRKLYSKSIDSNREVIIQDDFFSVGDTVDEVSMMFYGFELSKWYERK